MNLADELIRMKLERVRTYPEKDGLYTVSRTKFSGDGSYTGIVWKVLATNGATVAVKWAGGKRDWTNGDVTLLDIADLHWYKAEGLADVL